MNAARPAIALSTVAAVAIGSAIAVTPAVAVSNPVPALATADGHNVLLAGFIADQIEILTSYGQSAVADTATWVGDLVTPLINLQFWPLSGQPGSYLTGAFNSTVNLVQGLADTTVGFIQEEINYFTNWIPNIPNVINNIIGTVVNLIQNVINWITGWIPRPLAAVAPSPAAAKVTAARAESLKRPLSQQAAGAASVSQNRKAARSAAKQSGRAAAARSATKAAH